MKRSTDFDIVQLYAKMRVGRSCQGIEMIGVTGNCKYLIVLRGEVTDLAPYIESFTYKD